MKYKVGDKIKIRSWNSMEQEYGLNERGFIKTPEFHFYTEEWCKKIVTIKEDWWPNEYGIKEDGFSWTDNMIDHVATEKIQRIIKKLNILRQQMVFNIEIDYLIDDIIKDPTKLTKKFAIILNNEYKKSLMI